MKSLVSRSLALLLVASLALIASGAAVQFTPAQQESVNKISGKGGLVMQLAADSDLVVVNLSLGGKQITDAEVSEVKNLPKVSQLNLANTAVTDAGLANVAGLSELTSLHLEKTGVTDAGLANLKNLSKLEYLNLYGTAVTDKGLANLSGLKNLKKLYLWQTKVTDAGVSALKKADAGLVVNRGEELAIVVKPPEAAPAAKPADAKPADGKTVATGAKPLNSKCPVSGKDVVLPNVLTYEGKLVGFCCDKCPKAFEKEPAKYAANIKFDIAPPATEKKSDAKPADAKPADKKPADAKPAEKKADDKKAAAPAADKPAQAAAAAVINTKCPVSNHAIETGFTALVDGKTVGFCCDKCLAKFNKDPKAFADKIVADAK